MSRACPYPSEVRAELWAILHRLPPTPHWHSGGLGRKPLALRRGLPGLFYMNQTGGQGARAVRCLGG